jgi:hypothetical protein
MEGTTNWQGLSHFSSEVLPLSLRGSQSSRSAQLAASPSPVLNDTLFGSPNLTEMLVA